MGNRGFFGVVLAQKSGQGFLLREVDPGEVKGFVPHQNSPPEEKDLELPDVPLAMEGKDVLVVGGVGDGLLLLQGLFDGRDLVPDAGRLLEVEGVRGLRHSLLQELD